MLSSLTVWYTLSGIYLKMNRSFEQNVMPLISVYLLVMSLGTINSSVCVPPLMPETMCSHPYRTTGKIIVLCILIIILVFFDSRREEKGGLNGSKHYQNSIPFYLPPDQVLICYCRSQILEL
jgi:hypothetical protein